jgi:hypothetical protein
MIGTEFFQCDYCHVECRIDFVEVEPLESSPSAPFMVRHCAEGKGISVSGIVTNFMERRGGLWVDVKRWIYAA